MSDNYTYQLTVIIVNYNVQFFLDQCLDSVKKASNNVSTEIIVVDNNSIDGSLNMIKSKYPEIQLIDNKENVGFSKANNQAIQVSQGKYVLLLNPDTVVAEDTFEKTIKFMDEHLDCGGLGIHMVDGKGNFLPESKRGLPTPIVAFYKIFGLSSLFPKSKKFSQYHLGHLSKDENHEIDVLSGAFMLMRKSALDKVGFLDEEFFMYGEDIDLSYRIKLGGYKNYYCSDSSIIHYKGESTKKSSVNYVFVFYNAMIIFAKKHFSSNRAKLFSFLINFAIYLRASLALLVRFIKKTFLPFIDFIYIVGGLFALTNYWRMSSIEFPEDLIGYSIPIYTVTWLGLSTINGAYDFPVNFFKHFKGVFWGTIVILIAYAVLPKSWQFSRLFIFIGAGWVFFYFLISRIFLHFALGRKFKLRKKRKTNFAIIGSQNETERINTLLSQTIENIGIIEFFTKPEELVSKEEKFDEVIFSSKDLGFKEIIYWTKELSKKGLDFKIAPENEQYFIGSNSIDTAGDLYILNLNNILTKENQRKKRFFDFTISFLLIITSPIGVFFISKRKNYLANLIQILIGKLSFVGYSDKDMQKDVRLPKIKPSILSPSDRLPLSDDSINEKLNLLYSRDYSMRKDFSIVANCWKKLAR